MTKQKITTQKVHKVLKDAGYVSSLYKPSQKINRKGYGISTYLKGVYVIAPLPYTPDEIIEALNNAGIKSFEKNTMVGVEIFQ